jgi:hypothetical protein
MGWMDRIQDWFQDGDALTVSVLLFRLFFFFAFFAISSGLFFVIECIDRHCPSTFSLIKRVSQTVSYLL